MSLFNDYELTVLDLMFGSGSPAQYELGLSRTAINDNETGILEPSGGSYARLTIDNDVTTFPAAALLGGIGTQLNGIAFTFPTATGSWSTVTHWFLYDFVNALYVVHGPLEYPKAVAATDIFRIPASKMVITVD